MADRKRAIHPDGFVGVESDAGGVTILGYGYARLPVRTRDIRWLTKELERILGEFRELVPETEQEAADAA